jgi:hypothetical protein
MIRKADYTELTRLGVRARLAELERYVADLHKEFPDEFASPTAPVFLKGEEKPGGNSWPPMPVLVSGNGHHADAVLVPAKASGWSQEQRAKQAQRMRDRANAAKWGTLLWHKVHDYLLKQPKHTANFSVMVKTLKVRDSSLGSVIRRHPDRLKRVSQGIYQLTKPVTAAQKKNGGGETAAPAKKKPSGKGGNYAIQPWGTFHWQKIHDYLLLKNDHTAPISELIADLKIKSQASAITSMQGHKDLFRRSGPGTYQLIKEASAEQRGQ